MTIARHDASKFVSSASENDRSPESRLDISNIETLTQDAGKVRVGAGFRLVSRHKGTAASE